MAEKQLLSMRLTKEALGLIHRMSERDGISHTAIIELAIREKASREQLTEAESPDRARRQAVGHA